MSTNFSEYSTAGAKMGQGGCQTGGVSAIILALGAILVHSGRLLGVFCPPLASLGPTLAICCSCCFIFAHVGAILPSTWPARPTKYVVFLAKAYDLEKSQFSQFTVQSPPEMEPNSAQRRPQSLPKRAKASQRVSQSHPKVPPKSPKGTIESKNDAQGSPTALPECPQWPQGALKSSPRVGQERPKAPKRAPKAFLRVPKSIPRECLRDLSGCFGASRFRLCRIRCAKMRPSWG